MRETKNERKEANSPIYPAQEMSNRLYFSSSPSKQITVIDVYDLAESINRDFEELVEQFGNEPFDSVVRKVISALETLEALAKYNDKESSDLLDLQNTIERFEQEKQQRLRDKENLEKDFLDLEENYKQEIEELCNIIQKLKAENKKIRDQISASSNSVCSDHFASVDQDSTDLQIQVLVDLRKMTQTQKERIKELQKDLGSYCDEVDTLRDNIERLIRQNKELLRKNSSLQKQGRVLLLERAEILRRLQQAEEEILQLRKVLNETSRACRDMEVHMQQQHEPKEYSQACFTLSELREVLQEKNTLKAKVLELEERLSDQQQCREGDASILAKEGSISVTDTSPSDISAEECLAVFGPINREPEEKLRPWKYERKDSGVRKFFRFFKVSLGTSLTPQEASSKLGEL